MRTSTIDERFSSFLKNPSAARLALVRECVTSSPEYDPYGSSWNELSAAFDAEDFDAVRRLAGAVASWTCLSPRYHFWTGVAAMRLGDHVSAKRARRAYEACLRALLRSGDGTVEQPYLSTYPSDAYVVLAELNIVPVRQSLLEQSEGFRDVICDRQGNQYWFDVDPLLRRATRPAIELGCGSIA